jgi:hypothetical protein
MKKIMFNDKFGLTEAVLNGKKTMTRRICKYERPDYTYDAVFPVFRPEDYDEDGNIISPLNKAFGWATRDGKFTGWNKAQYRIGEVVAIAQSYHSFYNDECDPRMFPSGAGWLNKMLVKPELMPHQIQITDISIQKLQCISDEDCLKEGVIKNINKIPTKAPQYIINYYPCEHYKECAKKVGWGRVYNTPREAFAALIDKVSGKGTWDSNPYVFVYEFKLIR